MSAKTLVNQVQCFALPIALNSRFQKRTASTTCNAVGRGEMTKERDDWMEKSHSHCIQKCKKRKETRNTTRRGTNSRRNCRNFASYNTNIACQGIVKSSFNVLFPGKGESVVALYSGLQKIAKEIRDRARFLFIAVKSSEYCLRKQQQVSTRFPPLQLLIHVIITQCLQG